MAKREKYDVKIACECGNEGRMWAEENENPVESGGLGRTVTRVSDGFSIQNDGIVCKCGKAVSL